jgi:hypothetical protein
LIASFGPIFAFSVLVLFIITLYPSNSNIYPFCRNRPAIQTKIKSKAIDRAKADIMIAKNYADPIYSQQIANENLYIYKRLVVIYAKYSCQPNHQQVVSHQFKCNYRVVKYYAKIKEEKRIAKENLRLQQNLINAQADSSLSREQTEKSWSRHLRFKRQKITNMNK